MSKFKDVSKLGEINADVQKAFSGGPARIKDADVWQIVLGDWFHRAERLDYYITYCAMDKDPGRRWWAEVLVVWKALRRLNPELITDERNIKTKAVIDAYVESIDFLDACQKASAAFVAEKWLKLADEMLARLGVGAMNWKEQDPIEAKQFIEAVDDLYLFHDVVAEDLMEIDMDAHIKLLEPESDFGKVFYAINDRVIDPVFDEEGSASKEGVSILEAFTCAESYIWAASQTLRQDDACGAFSILMIWESLMEKRAGVLTMLALVELASPTGYFG